MPATDHNDLASRIQSLADEVIGPRPDLFVVDVNVRGQKGSRVVEVFIDSDEGVSLDALAEVSRELEFLLDTEDVIAGRYNLNVSSPGADRPLTHPRQYRANVGRQLRVRLQADQETKEVQGTLRGASPETIELEVDGNTEHIAFSDIIDARVQLPW